MARAFVHSRRTATTSEITQNLSPRESLYSGEATNLLLLLLSSGERDRDPRRGGERLRERDLNMSLSTAANSHGIYIVLSSTDQ